MTVGELMAELEKLSTEVEVWTFDGNSYRPSSKIGFGPGNPFTWIAIIPESVY